MAEQTNYAFLHGGVQGGWVWDETLAALGQQTGGGYGRALALDVPGCGRKRGRVTATLDLDAVAAELIADIEAAGMGEVVLVGHSLAGAVLPRMVEQRPGLFRRVVYVSAVAPLPGQTVLNFRSEGLPAHEPPAPPPGDDQNIQLRPLFCSDMNIDEADRFMAKLGQDDWPASSLTADDWRYDHLDGVPASYVVCLRDVVFPAAWQEVFAERLKARRRIVIDAGHQVMNTRPHALAEALRHEAR